MIFIINFISTTSIILLSTLRKRAPNLINGIIQCSSTISNLAKKTPAPTLALSSKQIQEACEHPSMIVKQTLGSIVILQDALNYTKNRANELAKQHQTIEDRFKILNVAKP